MHVQFAYAEMINSASDENGNSLRAIVLEKVKAGLESQDTDIQKTAIKMIFCIPEKERYALIQNGIINSISFKNDFAKIIPSAPKETWLSLIETALSTGNF